MRALLCVLSLLSSILFIDSLWAGTFHPWSDKFFEYISKEYGLQAEKRIRYLHDLIRTNQNKTVHEKLLLANNTLNKLPWIADKEHWDKVDYWATPLETISTFGGDCEDIAIAKWVMLRYLGVPANKLRLAYVKLKASGENHMILAYVDRIDLPREQREKHTWILDSIDQRLLTAPKRQDLLAVYATDADGNMILITESDNGRVMLGVHEKVKMKKLVELKEKIATNMAFAQKINDGRPLHPD